MVHRLPVLVNTVRVVAAVAVCKDAARVPHPQIVNLKFDDLHTAVQLTLHKCHITRAHVDYHGLVFGHRVGQECQRPLSGGRITSPDIAGGRGHVHPCLLGGLLWHKEGTNEAAEKRCCGDGAKIWLHGAVLF